MTTAAMGVCCGVLGFAVGTQSGLLMAALLCAVSVVVAIVVRPEQALLPLLMTCVAYQGFADALPISLLGVYVEPQYLALGFLLVGYLAYRLKRPGSPGVSGLELPMTGVVILLSIPVFVGVLSNYELQSILRSARVAVFYALFFVMWDIVRSRRQVAWVMKTIVLLGGVAVGFLALSRVMGWQWSSGMSIVELSSGTISRGYGWWSAMPWYVYAGITCLAYAVYSDVSTARRGMAAVASAVFLLACISTFVRGDFVGFVAGAFAVSIPAIAARTPQNSRRGRLLAIAVAGALSLTLVLTFAGSVPLVRDASERIASIVNPSSTVRGAAGSREYRIVGMAVGLNNAVSHPVGIGYGYPADGPSADQVLAQQYGSHGSLSWIGTYLGLFGGLALLAMVAVVGLRVWSNLVGTGSGLQWTTIGAIASLAAMLGQSLSENVFFVLLPVYPLVPLLLVVALRSGRSTDVPRTLEVE